MAVASLSNCHKLRAEGESTRSLLATSEKTPLPVKGIVPQRTNANEAVRIVFLIRTGFVLSDPATERQRSTCRRTPSLSYSGAVREANRSEFSTGGSKKRSPQKFLLKKSGAGQSDPAYRSPRSNIRPAHCHCQGQTQIVDLSLGGFAPSSREPIDRNFRSPVGLWIVSASISDSGDPVACHDFGGYRENMEDTGAKKLSVDFSQDRDLVGIKAKVLAFLKDDVAELGTVTCVIREAGEAGSTVPLVYHLGLGQAEAEIVEASAGEIAASLAEYAKGKDGKLYSDATLEILHP